MKAIAVIIVATLVLTLFAVSIEAYPARSHRQKRVSDQRLAELLTIQALIKQWKNKGPKLTVDPSLISDLSGRKKKSSIESYLDVLRELGDEADYEDQEADASAQEFRRYSRRRNYE